MKIGIFTFSSSHGKDEEQKVKNILETNGHSIYRDPTKGLDAIHVFLTNKESIHYVLHNKITSITPMFTEENTSLIMDYLDTTTNVWIIAFSYAQYQFFLTKNIKQTIFLEEDHLIEKFFQEQQMTLCYIVGGDDHHYKNVLESIQSTRKNNYYGHVTIVEFGKKLSTCTHYKVYHENELKPDKSGKVGYLYWMQKYRLIDFVSTKYGMYVDSDTLMFYNNITDIMQQTKDKIGICQHWWVKNIERFRAQCLPTIEAQQKFHEIMKEYNIKNLDIFFAAGVFCFEVNKNTRMAFEAIYRKYYQMYENNNYISGITDEVFLCAILHNTQIYTVINGAMNHCCMGDDCSDLRINNDRIEGKNTFDTEWAPITFIHCDRARRNPIENYRDMKRRETLSNKIESLTHSSS